MFLCLFPTTGKPTGQCVVERFGTPALVRFSILISQWVWDLGHSLQWDPHVFSQEFRAHFGLSLLGNKWMYSMSPHGGTRLSLCNSKIRQDEWTQWKSRGPLRLVEKVHHRRGQREARNTETRGGGQRGHVSQICSVDTEIKPGSPDSCGDACRRLNKTLTCSFYQQEFQTFKEMPFSIWVRFPS